MTVEVSGSVRVDLVGGTLDLEPINLILPNVVTLNVATSLKAKVTLEEIKEDVIKISSLDYEKEYVFKESELTDENLRDSSYFKEMSFVLQIINLFGVRKGLHVKLQSGAPAGSGLGGSSAMGVTLYKALEKVYGGHTELHETVLKVKGVESRILNQGVPGYQDYYPALTGGVLCLSGEPGKINCEQLYSDDLKEYLESHLTLVYSGISRNSGINNWDVYKSFFDQKNNVRESLEEIAKISYSTYQAIKNKKYDLLPQLISSEGESRKTLAESIAPKQVISLVEALVSDSLATGFKMCGAGGGGCFIITHDKLDSSSKEKLHKVIESAQMQVLDFKIERPL